MALDVNPRENLDLHRELISLKSSEKRKTIVKCLIALALIVMAIFAIALLKNLFVAAAIGVIVIATLSIYNYLDSYRDSRAIFLRSAGAMLQTVK